MDHDLDAHRIQIIQHISLQSRRSTSIGEWNYLKHDEHTAHLLLNNNDNNIFYCTIVNSITHLFIIVIKLELVQTVIQTRHPHIYSHTYSHSHRRCSLNYTNSPCDNDYYIKQYFFLLHFYCNLRGKKPYTHTNTHKSTYIIIQLWSDLHCTRSADIFLKKNYKSVLNDLVGRLVDAKKLSSRVHARFNSLCSSSRSGIQ
jgi:hypothetical protein